MFTTARQKQHTRERLDTCLVELNQMRPTALLHEDVLGTNHSFRAGLPCFERTLELFHRLSRCYLDHVPLADLKNITDDAANTLDQFRKILNFTGDNVENPREARDLLIYDVDASFPRISANFATVVSQPPRRGGTFRCFDECRFHDRFLHTGLRLGGSGLLLHARRNSRGQNIKRCA